MNERDLLARAIEALRVQEEADTENLASIGIRARDLRRAVLRDAAAAMPTEAGWRSTVGMFDGDTDMEQVLRNGAQDAPGDTHSPSADGERLTDERGAYAVTEETQ